MLRVARLDGLGVLLVAGLFAVLSALASDRLGAIVGLLVAGAGAVELHGAALLEHGERRGTRWLVASQLYLLVVVLGYCQYRLTHLDLALLRSAVTDELRNQLAQRNRSVDDFLRLMNNITFAIIAVVTLAYQGGMALYYYRRRHAVAQALLGADY